ncbi:MAG: WG repeat-containing protein [Planctomycetota bacterium]
MSRATTEAVAVKVAVCGIIVSIAMMVGAGCARQEVFPVVTRSGLVFVTESGDVREIEAVRCGSVNAGVDDYLVLRSKDGLMYVCDLSGRRVVDVGFTRTFANSKYFGGRRQDGLWAVYTYEGDQVGSSWKGLNGISEYGMAAVTRDGNSWGVADTEGEWVIEPKYTVTRCIGGRLFGVGVGGEEHEHELIPRVHATWGLARDDGTVLREPFATGIGFVAQREQPLIPYSLDSFLDTGLVGAGGKWGFLDKSGSVVVKPRFVGGAGEFENDRCCVAIEKDGKKIYGFIDGNGVMVIEPQFNGPHVFSEGLAAVLVEGQWGYVDRAGEYAIAPQYQEAISFSEGRGAVKKDGLWGFIDSSGREVIPCRYVDLVQRFWRGVATVRTRNETLLIDRSGNVVWSSGPEE